jgi:hypothetical protein
VAAPNLRDKSLDQTVAGVLNTGHSEQMRSIMAVVARSAIELSDGLGAAAKEVRHLTDSTATFNAEAGKLTQPLVRLNRSLTQATWAIAGGTILLVVVGILAAGRTH